MKKQFSAIGNEKFIHLVGSPWCGEETLPPTDFNFCTPNVRLSEIRRIFIAKVGAQPFNAWGVADEWNERVNETSMHIDVIRPLTVIGDKPLPNSIKKDISFQRRKVIRKDHTVHATIDEVNDDNHNFIVHIGTGKRFRMWYETWGGYMFGGNGGIICMLYADMLLPRGQSEIMTYLLTAEWNNIRTEDQITSPIFNTMPVYLLNDNGTILQNDNGEGLQPDSYL